MILLFEIFLFKLHKRVFNHTFLPYLTVQDLVQLDNVCLNHRYRFDFILDICNTKCDSNINEEITLNLLLWLRRRIVYLRNLNLNHHQITNGIMKNTNVIVNIRKLLVYCKSIKITNKDILRILYGCSHCRDLQEVIIDIADIRDKQLISVSERFPKLTKLQVNNADLITDTSIMSVSTHCTQLKYLDISFCHQLTDASILSISTLCTGLTTLNITGCTQLTDNLCPLSKK